MKKLVSILLVFAFLWACGDGGGGDGILPYVPSEPHWITFTLSESDEFFYESHPPGFGIYWYGIEVEYDGEIHYCRVRFAMGHGVSEGVVYTRFSFQPSGGGERIVPVVDLASLDCGLLPLKQVCVEYEDFILASIGHFYVDQNVLVQHGWDDFVIPTVWYYVYDPDPVVIQTPTSTLSIEQEYGFPYPDVVDAMLGEWTIRWLE